MQQGLFSAEPESSNLPPWEIDDLKNRKIAKVIFPSGYDAALDYLVPNHLAGTIETGMRVVVPLGKGNRPQIGYCIDIQPWGFAEPSVKLKPVLSLLDDRRLFDDKMLELTRWIAHYYLCPLGQVLEAILPVGVRDHAGTRLTTVLFMSQSYDCVSANLTPKQLHIIATLGQSPEPLTMKELQRTAKCSAVPINTLKRLNIIQVKTIRRQVDCVPQTADGSRESVPTYKLNADQQRVLSAIVHAIEQRRHEVFLLHGVTGSGKTEVYIQAIQAVVKRKKQAIVLVPEISLTPQTVGRFQSRFANVAVLHSHLTDAERHRQWSNIASGKVQVVVGARSAVFAPLPRLGLMVIDEEHENSFKQESMPRYHARDVACKRAEIEGISLILGSATPSLETFYESRERSNAEGPDQSAEQSGHCTSLRSRLSLPHRVKNLQLPNVEIVDLREEVRLRTTRGAIHRQLHRAMHETLLAKGQIILLLNRRGFSTQIQCPACGEAVKCPHCDVSLTHHKTEEIALCHYCDYQMPVPKECPKCKFASVRFFGFGTQKLEAEVKSRFPNASVLRMDTDTMQGHGAHERAFAQFRSGEVQILLGTQMIAKGLDFPNVMLVGVINADTALHFPDFRAQERTFHLITQVAGRTGRGERGGRVIIQTFSPDNPAIQAAAQHDYQRFVEQELPMRKQKNIVYPPYGKMIRIVVRGEDEKKTSEFAKTFAERLRLTLLPSAISSLPSVVLGPAPPPKSKLKNFYRFHILLCSESGESLRECVRSVSLALKTPPDVQWIIDVDPVDML